jgi:uncharacterized tellurite resistance protein B-like protein
VLSPAVAKCLVVSNVLIADGMMMDEEREFLTNLMNHYGLDDADRKQVIDLDGLREAERIVAALTEEERREVVEFLVDAAGADGKLSPLEFKTVTRISKALGIG